MSLVRNFLWLLTIVFQIYRNFATDLHRFKRRGSLDDKRCPVDSVLFTLDKSDTFRCLLECYHTRGCVSVFVKDADRKCWGCTECQPDSADLTDESGIKFWHSSNFIVFGVEGVPNDQLSESSSKGDDTHYKAFNADPHRPIGLYGATHWAPVYRNTSQFVQVDFRRAQTVTAIGTKAHGHWRYPSRVEEYRVLYSDDCINFEYVRDAVGDPLLFPGNTDWTTLRVNSLPEPITSVCFRINPTKWSNHIELRFDIVGCALFV